MGWRGRGVAGWCVSSISRYFLVLIFFLSAVSLGRLPGSLGTRALSLTSRPPFSLREQSERIELQSGPQH